MKKTQMPTLMTLMNPLITLLSLPRLIHQWPSAFISAISDWILTFDLPLRAAPILFLLTGLCSGCSPFEQSDQRMTDEQFVAFFVAMSKATKQYVEEPARLREAHQALYRDYGTSPEVVQATIAYYQEQPERWVAILEQIREELSKSGNEGREDKERKK